MATLPGFVKNGVARTEAQGVSFRQKAEGGGFTYDTETDKNVPTTDALKAIREDLKAYLSAIASGAKDLVSRGRADAANNLRTLGDRLKRIANTRGVSAEQIARQMSDIGNQVNSQSALFESKVMADKLSRINDTISKKMSLEGQINNRDASNAQFREQVLKNMEQPSDTPIQTPIQISPSGTGTDNTSPVSIGRNMVAAPMSTGPSNIAMDNLAMDNLQNMYKKTAIASFLDNKDYANRASNPLYKVAGPQNNMAQAGYAVAQANMGVMPGLFQSKTAIGSSPSPAYKPNPNMLPASQWGVTTQPQAASGYTKSPIKPI